MKEKWQKFLEIWNGKALFIPRVIAWLTLVGVVPIILISQQYSLWKTPGGAVDWTIWGVIGWIIVACSVYALIGWIVRSFEYSFTIQLLDGFRRLIIWLIVAYFACVAINNNIEKVQYILQWSMLSCSCGIIINPLPRWSYKHKVEKIKKEMSN